MDEPSGQGPRSNQSTNTSRRSQPGQGGEPSSRISLPSHPAERASQTPAYPSPGRQPPTSDPYSRQSTSRSSSNPSPSSPFDDPMSRYGGQGPTTVATSRSQQYQLVSPGTPADPRTMSQVSPGFIFVIFPMFADAFVLISLTPFPLAPISFLCPIQYILLYVGHSWRTQHSIGTGS